MLANTLLATLAWIGADPRLDYDVRAYRLDLRVDPKSRTLAGEVAVEARVVAEELTSLVLDLDPRLEVREVRGLRAPLDGTSAFEGAALRFEREGARVRIQLAEPRKQDGQVGVVVSYAGTPLEKDGFEGFHWKRSADGSPWMTVACQGIGSSSWWPGKDSYWHPEDKPERIWINLEVPAGLTGVSNGKLVGRERRGDWELFRWDHPYPCETYAVSINVAKYAEVARRIEVGGTALDFVYWVLPEHAERAKVQFAEVPAMLTAFSEAFGEYPFAKAKFALVETPYWGMEHSTCVAYGSSFPKWCEQHGERDGYSSANRWFDYILVHESAHEWWGNGVSAKSWGDFWIHEGFATYAEAVYVEKVLGEEHVGEFMEGLKSGIGPKERLFRGEGVDSGRAYAGVIYAKGAWVLHTLRWYVGDDELWWKTLREFQAVYRYRNAGTEDFRAVLERTTGKKWEGFFRDWVYGSGYPMLKGRVRTEGKQVLVEVENSGSGETGFVVPLEVSWRDGKDRRRERVMLDPGTNRVVFECKVKAKELGARGWEHVLGRHEMKVE